MVGDEMASQRHRSRETAIERSTDTAWQRQLRVSRYYGNLGQTGKLGSDSIFIISTRRCTEIRLAFFDAEVAEVAEAAEDRSINFNVIGVKRGIVQK
jgi:hypothetical protein